MQNENKIIVVDFLADDVREPPISTPRVTIQKSKKIRSQKQIESFNNVLIMMAERRKIKRELKEEEMVKLYFERKMKELQIPEVEPEVEPEAEPNS